MNAKTFVTAAAAAVALAIAATALVGPSYITKPVTPAQAQSVASTDKAAIDVDLYVYDDVGSLILDDRRVGRLSGVQFRSSYNGTTKVYVHMNRAIGMASWYVLVGRRGSIKPDTYMPGTSPAPATATDPSGSAVSGPVNAEP